MIKTFKASDSKYIKYLFPIIFILLILNLLLFYFSIYIILHFGISVIEVSQYPAIELIQDSDKSNFNEKIQLDIFNNKNYNGEKIIYCGTKGDFDFIIENKSPADIRYSIELSDINDFCIPMLYRLKLDNAYIRGENITWLTIDYMKIQNLILLAESKSLISLEWKWDENSKDDQDTHIGNSENATYTLKITVKAEYKEDYKVV